MNIQRVNRVRNFHQAKWDEEVIFQLHSPGERGIIVSEADQGIQQEVGNGISSLPSHLIRKEEPALPEVGQMRVLKHFLRLSQHTLGADLNIDIGQGTCTVKYNPKINEVFVRNTKASKLHPYQDQGTIQGALQIMHSMDLYFREISGMDRFTFQPSSGSHAILIMASIMHKYHSISGESHRDELITTIFSHPSDAAAAAVKGYKVITIFPDKNGFPDIEALKKAVSPRTAGLFITNPEDIGIFNPSIDEFTRIIHEAGGLCGYDQANANGILGVTRAKEAGFDMSFFNLHKTFASPHGCGGPAGGALGVTKALESYLPVPLVDYKDGKYLLNWDNENTIGKTRSFFGPFPVILRSYAWIRSLGEEGLREVSRIAVLNNNYILKKLTAIEGVESPFPGGKHRIEQVRYTWEKFHHQTGVDIHNVIFRMCDFGFHLWTSHHPYIVPEPCTIEPTESYSKAELDEYLDALRYIAEEARNDPEMVKNAPHRSVVHKIDESWFDDPQKWAITWRSFLKKHGDEFKKQA